MASQQLPRGCPSEGFSIARKVMDDAAAHYLAHGGPAVARIELANLANGLKFYNDYMEAYQAALEKVAQAEAMEHQKRLQEIADLMRAEQKTAQSAARPEPGVLPPKLSTAKAMLMWQRLQQAGYIDEQFQPIGLSRAMLTVIADEIMARIGDENEKLLGFNDKWTHFEILWGKKNLRTDHYHALYKENASDFREKIQLLFADIP